MISCNRVASVQDEPEYIIEHILIIQHVCVLCIFHIDHD